MVKQFDFKYQSCDLCWGGYYRIWTNIDTETGTWNSVPVPNITSSKHFIIYVCPGCSSG